MARVVWEGVMEDVRKSGRSEQEGRGARRGRTRGEAVGGGLGLLVSHAVEPRGRPGRGRRLRCIALEIGVTLKRI